MTVSLEALMAAVNPAVVDAWESLPERTIMFREGADADGWYGVLSNDRDFVLEMRVPAVVHVRAAVVAMAEVVQQSVAQSQAGAGLSGGWPTCTAHPAQHPLHAAVVDREASWVCPATGESVALIGRLVAPEDAERRRASELAAEMAWFARYDGLDLDEAKRLAAAEGRLVRFIGPDGGRRGDLRFDRLNLQLGPDGELIGMDAG